MIWGDPSGCIPFCGGISIAVDLWIGGFLPSWSEDLIQNAFLGEASFRRFPAVYTGNKYRMKESLHQSDLEF
jgi:hypothetical protein